MWKKIHCKSITKNSWKIYPFEGACDIIITFFLKYVSAIYIDVSILDKVEILHLAIGSESEGILPIWLSTLGFKYGSH